MAEAVATAAPRRQRPVRHLLLGRRGRREIHRQALSIALAIIPFGVAFGIASADAGLTAWQASAFSLLVFAGSAQFAAVEVIGDGARPWPPSRRGCC